MLDKIRDTFSKKPELSNISYLLFIALLIAQIALYNGGIIRLILLGVYLVVAFLTRFPAKAFTKKKREHKLPFVLAVAFSVPAFYALFLKTYDLFYFFTHYTTIPTYILKYVFLFVNIIFIAWTLSALTDDFDKVFGQRFFKSFFAAGTLVFILMVYLPFDSFIANISNFEFTAKEFLAMHITCAISSAVLISVLISALKEKIYRIAFKCIFALDVAMIIQYLFQNSHLSLLGVANDNAVWDAKVLIVNTLIWIAVFAAVFALDKFARDSFDNMSKILSILLLVFHIGFFAYSAVYAPEEVFNMTYEYYFDTTGQYTLSKNDNVLLFVFDALDNNYIKNLIVDEPQLFEGMEDFTVYTNTTSVYDSTVTSMNQFIGGCTFDNTLKMEDWMKKGWESDTTVAFFDNMHKNGYTCNAYNMTVPYEPVAYGKLDNLKKYDEPKAVKVQFFDKAKFFEDFEKLSVYRAMPYLIKNLIKFDDSTFKYYATFYDHDRAKYMNSDYIGAEDFKYIDEKLYMINHLNGIHSPCVVETELHTTFDVMHDIIDTLKEQGVYDNSTIIFISDHGSHNEDVESGWGATPMFMIKPKGAHNDKVTRSAAPVSHTDIMATVAAEAGIADTGDYGVSVLDLTEDTVRTRYFYDRIYEPELPEIYTTGRLSYIIMYNAYAEFEVTGDSSELYGLDPHVNNSRILPMKEYFG